MRPAGYLAKHVASRPDWISAGGVLDVYSLSGCISADFADYINVWKHNGFWLFDSPETLAAAAAACRASLEGTKLFFYEVLEREYDQEEKSWRAFEADPSFPTNVLLPVERTLEGFDVVNFFARSSPECSPLSCNNLAKSVAVNEHCLFATLQDAIAAVEAGVFSAGEPGPLRIFAVFSVAVAPN